VNHCEVRSLPSTSALTWNDGRPRSKTTCTPLGGLPRHASPCWRSNCCCGVP
jgi:hypothetical protein